MSLGVFVTHLLSLVVTGDSSSSWHAAVYHCSAAARTTQ